MPTGTARAARGPRARSAGAAARPMVHRLNPKTPNSAADWIIAG